MEQKELFLPVVAETTDRQQRFGKMRKWFHKVSNRMLISSGVEFADAGLDIFEDDSQEAEVSAVSTDAPKLLQRRVRAEVSDAYQQVGATEHVAVPEPVAPALVDRTPQDKIAHLEWKKTRMAEVTDLNEYRTAKQNYLNDPLNAPMPAAAAGHELIHDQIVQEQYGPFTGKHAAGQ
jgi:hypothetical protein